MTFDNLVLLCEEYDSTTHKICKLTIDVLQAEARRKITDIGDVINAFEDCMVKVNKNQHPESNAEAAFNTVYQINMLVSGLANDEGLFDEDTFTYLKINDTLTDLGDLYAYADIAFTTSSNNLVRYFKELEKLKHLKGGEHDMDLTF